MSRQSLSLSQARRVALAAQGFNKQRPTRVTRRHIRDTVRKLGLLQLDFVNVLVPAHLFVLYSRLGAYDREHFTKVIYDSPDFIEHWAHEASIVPVECWPLLEYRRQSYQPWPNSPIMKIKGKGRYLESALDIVRDNGPILSSDLPAMEGPKRKPGDWHRSVPRWALEVHFGQGNVSVAGRLPNYQRLYDLPENVVAEPHFSSKVSEEEAYRQLLAVAARSHGVATLQDLADYFRMTARDAAPRVAELVEEGLLRQVQVESWNAPAYLHRDVVVPRAVHANSLLSPFDPVVWFRPRGERLFDFHYRIEIYVPAAKRRFGYYVLPFLFGDRIAGRVDLKADRKNSTLLVLAAYEEVGIDSEAAATGLASELQSLAGWLGLDRVKVSRKGNLARALAAACRG